MPFEPKFTITPRIANNLMRIEAAKQAVEFLPITPSVLASLRESSRLLSTHYSTTIEGNRLTQEQVAQVIGKRQHFPGRDRDENEVLGYYAALAKAEQVGAGTIIVSEQHVQTLHALVMAGGQQGEAFGIPKRPERDPRRPKQSYRLYASRGQGCTRADE